MNVSRVTALPTSVEPTAFGLPVRVWKRIEGVFAGSAAVERVVLYGSRAKGNYREGSDIDLTIVGTSAIHDDLLKLSVALDDLDLPWMIDLSLLHRINNPSLVAHIERVGLVVYQRTNKLPA